MYKQIINKVTPQVTPATIKLDKAATTLCLSGSWAWVKINEEHLKQQLTALSNNKTITQIDMNAIVELDTAGAYFIDKILKQCAKNDNTVTINCLNEHHSKLLSQIRKTLENLNPIEETLSDSPKEGMITQIGVMIIDNYKVLMQMVVFLGQFLVNTFYLLKTPFSLEWRELARTITDAGIRGAFVASLLSFLIGATLAYEMSPQFITYGANVYIVNFLGISLLREVSPLLTAIIVAGRSGASLTAEISTMKIQEEIDALKSMGISPIKRIVVPKVLGITIALPIITAIAGAVSMLGGALITSSSLGLSLNMFVNRTQLYVSVNNYCDGIIKSVAFAIAIALTGCFYGFNVEGDANSIGTQTTKSVVVSLIIVVFIDAIFAIIFDRMGR
jgi:phospholipid/cholesterol/gamma-HCH transport system permease protein